MYGILLMAAMTGTTASPDFFLTGGWCRGGCGWGHCNWGSGAGYGVGACYGWGGMGYASCFGCGGYGCGGYGCGGYGCAGYGCGGYGGAGYGYAGYGSGGLGCAGYGYGGWGGCSGCFGGHGTYGCSGFIGCAGGTSAPVVVPEGAPYPRADLGPQASAAGRARLTVTLPADARLFVDGQAVKTVSGTKTFTTPRLEKGQDYFYEVQAEVVRDGKPMTETKRVVVRAGEEAKVAFSKLDSPAVATADASPRP